MNLSKLFEDFATSLQESKSLPEFLKSSDDICRKAGISDVIKKGSLGDIASLIKKSIDTVHEDSETPSKVSGETKSSPEIAPEIKNSPQETSSPTMEPPCVPELPKEGVISDDSEMVEMSTGHHIICDNCGIRLDIPYWTCQEC